MGDPESQMLGHRRRRRDHQRRIVHSPLCTRPSGFTRDTNELISAERPGRCCTILDVTPTCVDTAPIDIIGAEGIGHTDENKAKSAFVSFQQDDSDRLGSFRTKI